MHSKVSFLLEAAAWFVAPEVSQPVIAAAVSNALRENQRHWESLGPLGNGVARQAKALNEQKAKLRKAWRSSQPSRPLGIHPSSPLADSLARVIGAA
jgi:hypothetical protein